MESNSHYDAVIIAGGHNGLIAACYLASAGLRVFILEKNDAPGGATRSKKLFPRINARVSAYSYLISLRSINHFIQGDFTDCLAVDANGELCIEAKSPLDLENELALPRGNIFHGDLTWPFAENEADAGTWGMETIYPNVFICGSSAKRGGAVSGIPGHNAAMKILGRSA